MSAEPQPNHLVKGLMILGERWITRPWKWIRAGENWFVVILRAVGVGAPAYIGWRIVSSSWKLLGVAVLVVIVKALRAATKAVKGEPAKAKEPAGEPLSGVRLEMSEEHFQACIWNVLDGAPAVHLATLAARFPSLTGATWTGDDIRALCKTHGIPIRPKVRDLGGDRVSSGIHRDDLEPLPQPLPEGAPEVAVDDYAAGQGGNTTPLPASNDTTPTRTNRRVGDLRIVAVDDPDNPARTHVRVVDPTRKRA